VAWHDTGAARLLGVRYPIVQAPMAGVTTPALAAAVSEAGGLGSLGCANDSPDELRRVIRDVRALTERPFLVNLFDWPPIPPVDPAAAAAMRDELREAREAVGAEDVEPTVPDVRRLYEGQLAVLLEERVPVVSFHFGIPELAPFREAGQTVVGTATTPGEARTLEAAGVDLVCAQGWEAGGHRGTFERPAGEVRIGTLVLVPQVVDAVSVPVFAAGGLMDGRAIAAALALGAEGAWLGTAFMATPESAAHPAHKRALRESALDGTVVTDAFTGRHARMLRSPIVERLVSSGRTPLPYPVQGRLTRPVTTAALERDDLDHAFLLAGQGAHAVRELPAAELLAVLVAETDEALARVAH
jgi:nitronate monooxygenase